MPSSFATPEQYDRLVAYMKHSSDVELKPCGDGFVISNGLENIRIDDTVVRTDCAHLYRGINWDDLLKAGVTQEELERCYMVHTELYRIAEQVQTDSSMASGQTCALGTFLAWMSPHVGWLLAKGAGWIYLGHTWDRPGANDGG